MYLIYLLLCLALAVIAFVRVAPHDVARWHVAPDVKQDEVLSGGVRRRISAAGDALDRLDKIARSEPRTKVLAGSVKDGMITYISRSKVIGFPDYTTLHKTGDGIEIYGRLRFGRSDFGVNAARIERWIDAL